MRRALCGIGPGGSAIPRGRRGFLSGGREWPGTLPWRGRRVTLTLALGGRGHVLSDPRVALGRRVVCDGWRGGWRPSSSLFRRRRSSTCFRVWSGVLGYPCGGARSPPVVCSIVAEHGWPEDLTLLPGRDRHLAWLGAVALLRAGGVVRASARRQRPAGFSPADTRTASKSSVYPFRSASLIHCFLVPSLLPLFRTSVPLSASRSLSSHLFRRFCFLSSPRSFLPSLLRAAFQASPRLRREASGQRRRQGLLLESSPP